MKVLYIADKIDKYGSIDSMMQMIDALVENYDIVPIIIISNEGRLSEWAKRKGYEYFCLNYKSFFVHISTWYLKIFKIKFVRKIYGLYYKYFENKCINKISKKIDFSSIDIIHTNINRVGLGSSIARKFNIPHVWHIREISSDTHYELLPIFDCYKLRFKEAAKIIFISNTVRDYWLNKGFGEKNSVVISDGIIYKNRLVNREILRGDSYKIVMAGFICKNKGQDQLLKAISLLPDNIKSKIIVDLYGDFERKYYKYLNKIINECGLSNIRFKGYVENVQNRFDEYDLGIVCSKVEGLGRVTVDYIQHGCLVVASKISANLEIIKDGKTGFLYDYNDTKMLRDKILEAIVDYDKSNRIVHEAQINIENKYDCVNFSKSIYREYKNIIL